MAFKPAKDRFPQITSKSFTEEDPMKKIISQCFMTVLLFSSIGLPSFILAESQKAFSKNDGQK